MKSKKRGSLSLSMNAIVVLIMAIAMLGVGLGVINMVRKAAESEVARLGAEVPEATIASAGNRLTLSGEPIVGSRGEQKAIKISYYPLEDFTGDNKLGPKVNCSGLTTTLTYQSINKTLTNNTPADYTIIITTPSTPAQYICSVTMNDTSKDFRIIVQ